MAAHWESIDVGSMQCGTRQVSMSFEFPSVLRHAAFRLQGHNFQQACRLVRACGILPIVKQYPDTLPKLRTTEHTLSARPGYDRWDVPCILETECAGAIKEMNHSRLITSIHKVCNNTYSTYVKMWQPRFLLKPIIESCTGHITPYLTVL